MSLQVEGSILTGRNFFKENAFLAVWLRGHGTLCISYDHRTEIKVKQLLMEKTLCAYLIRSAVIEGSVCYVVAVRGREVLNQMSSADNRFGTYENETVLVGIAHNVRHSEYPTSVV